MARPTWKGYLGFGLVQLPVQLYPATQEDDIDFTMLDKKSLSPVGYKRVSKKTGKEIAWNDIVKGYEVSKGKYVVVEPEDLRAAHPKATRSIDITDFIDRSEISPLRFSNAYFVAPDPKAAPKAYVVLREALRHTGKVGVAKVVIRTRQHLCAVAVEGDAIVLALLRFDDELRNPKDIEELDAARHTKATKKEIDLAEELIGKLSGPWDSSQYRDEYEDALKKYIAKKVKTGEVGEAPELEDEEKEKGGEVVDLMAALQASLKGKAAPKAAPREKTARRGAVSKTRRKPTARRASPKKRTKPAAKKAA